MAQQDSNEAVWKSEETVKAWAEAASAREHRRAECIRFMASLLPFQRDERFTFIDLGAGTGMAARGIMDYYPNAHALLADYSAQMMDEGRKVLTPYEGRYSYVEFDMKSSTWPVGIPAALDAAVTSQCVHHLPDDRKAGLFGEILGRLKPGGWYLNFDPIKAADAEVEKVWQRVNDREDPGAAHQRGHRDARQQAMWENHVRYMMDLESQLALFRTAGFAAVDVYWKQLDYVIYGGCRPGA
ncbi:MAG TPA: class I SAM-dependent methyltransferase [Chloroflexota bacterium]|nr:class I SAM-dependent methyltransferase [Chloroflexota bacterium]